MLRPSALAEGQTANILQTRGSADAHELSDFRRRLLLERGDCVGVSVKGDADGRMAKPLLNNLRVNPGGQGERGVGVA